MEGTNSRHALGVTARSPLSMYEVDDGKMKEGKEKMKMKKIGVPPH